MSNFLNNVPWNAICQAACYGGIAATTVAATTHDKWSITVAFLSTFCSYMVGKHQDPPEYNK